MKKNRAMRTAAGLGIATLLTMSVISGSFAKYTTSTTGEDSARVAKWGFKNAATINLENLFSTEYAKLSDDKTNTVKSSVDVIAPGTEGTASFGFKYDTASDNVSAPEVAYNFTVSTEGSSIAESIENNPNIVWYLDDKACVKAGDKSSWDVLLEDIAKLSGCSEVDAIDGNVVAGTVEYEPGKLPAEFYKTNTSDSSVDGAKTHTVKWKWAFESSSDKDTQDGKDTEMGNGETLENVTLKITVTATQVD